MVRPYKDGIVPIAYLSEDKVDEKVDFTYSYLRALPNKASGTNTNSHTAANVLIHLYKSRFGSGFSRRLLNALCHASFQPDIRAHRR